MLWESFDGRRRELTWGELQDLANRAANLLASRGVGRGDRVAVVLPPTPETAAIFFGTWKLGAILLSMSVLYGDDGIQHRLNDSGARLLVTDADNAPRFDHDWAPDVLVLDEETLAAAPNDAVVADTAADDPAQLYYTSGTTGLAKGIVHAHRYLLAHEEFVYCHEVRGRRALPRDGRVGVGGRDRAAARALAARGGAVRVSPGGRLRSAQAARLPQPQPGHERVHDPYRDARDDGGRGRRHPLPAGLPARLLGRRAAQPGGDPLVPRAVRPDRARLLRAHRVVSARRQLPRDGGAGGLDGEADAGLGRADPRRGRAARAPRRAGRDLPPRPLEPALPARLLAERGGGARRFSAATGSTRRTRPSRTRTATTGTSGAPTM